MVTLNNSWTPDGGIAVHHLFKRPYLFFDGFFDEQHNMHITITKWRAKNVENKTYKNEHDEKGELMNWETVEMSAPNEDALREKNA